MNLVVYLPHQVAEIDSSALSLAQRAPIFTVRQMNGQQVDIAQFPSLPERVDDALQLIGEAIRFAGAWASVNDRPVSSLAKLWQRIECYRESLMASDPVRYCAERAALFNALVGCDVHRCPVPCQFLCTPCMEMRQDEAPIPEAQRFEVAAALAEIDWCPRLTLPARFGPTQPPLLNPGHSTM